LVIVVANPGFTNWSISVLSVSSALIQDLSRRDGDDAMVWWGVGEGFEYVDTRNEGHPHHQSEFFKAPVYGECLIPNVWAGAIAELTCSANWRQKERVFSHITTICRNSPVRMLELVGGEFE